MRSGWLVVMGIWALGGMGGCSSPNPNVRAHRLSDGRVEVEGGMAGPFSTAEALAESACALMTRQPGATGGLHGVEYCSVSYHSQAGGGFFLSYLSDIKNRADTAVKTCVVPAVVSDRRYADAIIVWGNHSHPHNRKFSTPDLSARSHWYPVRIAEKSTGRIFERGMMLFFKEKTGECRIYRYDHAARLVSALRQGQWIPIGKVQDAAGNIELFDGMDWLP